MKNALLPGLGGPMGRHATPRGLWFNPLPWAFLLATGLFLVLFLRHVPCVQTTAHQEIDMYKMLCYTDIQSSFLSQGFGRGQSPLGSATMLFAPLIAAAILVTRKTATAVFDAPIRRSATLANEVDASVTFFAITAVGLFACFLVLVACVAWLGRRRPGRPSWDALLVAASPVVLAVGLVNWDLVPVAFTALGLVQVARGRLVEAGIVLGLAASAGTMPIGVVLAVLVVAGLRGGWRKALLFIVPALVTFFAVHLPLLMQNFDRVYMYYHGEINRETSYGSLWYVLQLMFGLELRSSGSLLFVVLLLALGSFIAYLYVTRKRPRVGSMVAVVIFATLLLGPAYPPQSALWLLLALVVARPYKPEMAALALTQVLYYIAIWGWLGGWLTTNQNGPYMLYWAAIILHVAVEVWILTEVVSDIVQPARDALRTPDLVDPIGGVLNDGEVAVVVPGPEAGPLDEDYLAGFERPTPAKVG
ncbi:glycosyltransferase 87 family protein [Tessaracoccus lubricantis]|uniref:Glycosyltransferase 87 family protein n=1 Tax=Tessaracoccus lubricantis TaxID=545543 RepID=A0ABP9FCC9_9ACTN